MTAKENQAAKILDSHIIQWFDCYVLVGINTDGNPITISRGNDAKTILALNGLLAGAIRQLPTETGEH